MLESIISSAGPSIEIWKIVLLAVLSLVLGFIVAITHKYTSNTNKNFLITVTLLPLLVMGVIFMVNGSLGMSVAVAGTFSLVRFRSIPGTSKEILIVFFSMAVGLATGTGYVIYAILLTLLGSLVIFILSNTHVFDNNKYEKHLIINIPEDMDYTDIFDKEFKKYTTSFKLVNVKTVGLGSMFELKYNIILKKNVNEKKFIDDLRIKNGNLKIVLTEPISIDNL